MLNITLDQYNLLRALHVAWFLHLLFHASVLSFLDFVCFNRWISITISEFLNIIQYCVKTSVFYWYIIACRPGCAHGPSIIDMCSLMDGNLRLCPTQAGDHSYRSQWSLHVNRMWLKKLNNSIKWQPIDPPSRYIRFFINGHKKSFIANVVWFNSDEIHFTALLMINFYFTTKV